MTGIIISSICGIVSTGVGSFITWLLSKKKYHSEVESSNIKNMQDSLDFYIKLVEDSNKRLQDEIKEHNNEVKTLKQENTILKQELMDQEKRFNDKLEANIREMNLMKNQMLSVYGQVCLNFKCTERKVSKSTTTNKPTSKKHNDKKVENHKK